MSSKSGNYLSITQKCGGDAIIDGALQDSKEYVTGSCSITAISRADIANKIHQEINNKAQDQQDGLMSALGGLFGTTNTQDTNTHITNSIENDTTLSTINSCIIAIGSQNDAIFNQVAGGNCEALNLKQLTFVEAKMKCILASSAVTDIDDASNTAAAQAASFTLRGVFDFLGDFAKYIVIAVIGIVIAIVVMMVMKHKNTKKNDELTQTPGSNEPPPEYSRLE